EEMDVRPGGTWQFQLRGLDGRSRRRTLVYDELRPPQRLVYSDPIDRWRCVLTFDELGGATALGLRRVYPGPRERDRAVAEDNALGDSVEMVDRLLRRVVVKGARD
ncbi:MAG: SRPBCC domain-containing protein, partial [Candidatus Dormibacteria bacterium]